MNTPYNAVTKISFYLFGIDYFRHNDSLSKTGRYLAENLQVGRSHSPLGVFIRFLGHRGGIFSWILFTAVLGALWQYDGSVLQF